MTQICHFIRLPLVTSPYFIEQECLLCRFLKTLERKLATWVKQQLKKPSVPQKPFAWITRFGKNNVYAKTFISKSVSNMPSSMKPTLTLLLNRWWNNSTMPRNALLLIRNKFKSKKLLSANRNSLLIRLAAVVHPVVHHFHQMQNSAPPAVQK